jgi:hypothetical protein
MRNEQHTKYDIIGDIHGQQEKLIGLLRQLGYEIDEGSGVSHPEGRKVLFLGDFIDRGPAIREVLHLVRGMVDSGIALAVMGNHEFNAVAYHTPDGKGDYLRSHTAKGGKNVTQHKETLDAFEGLEEEWEGWIAWFKTLPMWLDMGDFRAVHACWHEKSMEVVGERSLDDSDFLVAAGTKGTLEYYAVEILLKGPEMRLPEGVSFKDKDGTVRTKARVRWWGHDGSMDTTVGDIAMPPGSIKCDTAVSHAYVATNVPNYPATAPPVFIGHYWMPPETAKEPLAANVVCLDYSAAREGPMVAYRWDGAMPVHADRFVVPCPGSLMETNSKIIFLDFDGVIRVPILGTGFPPESEWLPESKERVARLARETGASIVVSSDWGKRQSREEIVRSLAPEIPADLLHEDWRTPDLSADYPPRSVPRLPEILAWLDAHPGHGEYVILDDLGRDQFVAVADRHVPCVLLTGFTERGYELALSKV